MFSKLVENTVGKGEIARYEQFVLFPHCFQKACFPGASKCVIEWEWVILSSDNHIPQMRNGKSSLIVSSSNLKLSSANSLSMEKSKILLFGKVLICFFNFDLTVYRICQF